MLEALTVVHISIAVLALIAFFSALFLVYAIVRYRRDEVAPEWLEARQYIQAKGLAKDQWPVLASMLKRYASDNPYEAVTYRHEFDRCVREQINAIPSVAQRETMGEALREIRTMLDLVHVPEGARLSSTLDLEERKTITARRTDQDNSPMNEFYVKRVNDAFFYLAPRNVDVVRGVEEGARFLLQVYRPGDSRYEIIATVTAVHENPVTLMFGHVFKLKRLPPRAHERSAYTLPQPIDVFIVPKERLHDPLPWLYTNEPTSQSSGTFMNLGAGGFAAMLRAPNPPSPAYARVTIVLGDEYIPPFRVFAQIVSTVPIAEERTLIRAAFVDITPKQQEAIDQYVANAKEQESEAEEAETAEQEGIEQTQ